MSRHRRFLIIVGAVQLTLSSLLFLHYLGRKHWAVDHHAHVTRMMILERLEVQGLRLPTESERPDTDVSGAIFEPVRMTLESAESQAFVPIMTMTGLGLLLIGMGLIPERRRPDIHPEG